MLLCATVYLSLCLSLSTLCTPVTAACFTQSPVSSTCEPATTVANSPNIRQCLRPDLQVFDPSGSVGESVDWNPNTGTCVRRPTSCGAFNACSGVCLVSCDVASRGFLAFSIRTGVGVKSFELIDTPARSNGSVRSVPTASQLPGVFRANVLDQLPSVVPLLTFKEMVVSLLVANSAVVNVTFDLSLSPHTLDRTNWFSHANLKSCWPVSDLKSRTTNYVSIPGDVRGTWLDRRFFINYLYSNCDVDSSLMVSLDVPDVCSWGSSMTAPPRLMYNTAPNAPNLGNIRTADVLVVIIR